MKKRLKQTSNREKRREQECMKERVQHNSLSLDCIFGGFRIFAIKIERFQAKLMFFILDIYVINNFNFDKI